MVSLTGGGPASSSSPGRRSPGGNSGAIASSVTLREAPGAMDRSQGGFEDPLGVFEASATDRGEASRSPSHRGQPPPPPPSQDSAAADVRREESPVKRPWDNQQREGNSPRLRQRSASPARGEAHDDLLGLFQASPQQESPHRERGGRQAAGTSSAGGRSGANKGEDSGKDLDRRIADFVLDNGLEDRVGRIMKNMLPDDVERVLGEGGVPRNCTNPNAVVVARVRRVERAMQRPNAMKRYDKDNGKRPRSPSPYAPRRSRSSRRRSRGRGARGRGRVSPRGGGPRRHKSGRGRHASSGSSRSYSR